jgi:uncharacterized protein (DUF433 family)
MIEQVLKKANTNHPFVVVNKEVCGGSPTIGGTRTRVIDIAIEYEILGLSPDEIINAHPYLNLSQVHDALSYYYENRAALDKKIGEDQIFIKGLKKQFISKIT